MRFALILFSAIMITLAGCKKEDEPAPNTSSTGGNASTYNSGLNVQGNLDASASILDILKNQPIDSLYGKMYEGGYIFYVDTTDGSGMVAATADQSTGAKWSIGYASNISQPLLEAIGEGVSNTNAIVAAVGDGNYAAKLCDDLALGGYTDWFLPSKDELLQMYFKLYKKNHGDFSSDYYWSSSSLSASDDSAKAYGFAYGTGWNGDRTWSYSVRAARAF